MDPHCNQPGSAHAVLVSIGLQSHRNLVYEELCTAQNGGRDTLIHPLLQVEAAPARTDSWPAIDLAPVAMPVSYTQVSVQYSTEPAWFAKTCSMCLKPQAGGVATPAMAGPTWSLLEKAYKASGFSRWLIKSMASSRLLTVTKGRMGPKISSCITGSDSCTSTSTVGAADRGRHGVTCQGLMETRLQNGECEDLTSQDSSV